MDAKTGEKIFSLFNMSENRDEEIMLILENAYFAGRVCLAALPFIKSEDNILLILRKIDYKENVFNEAFKLLGFKNKTDNQILKLLNVIDDRDATILSIPYFKIEEKTEYQIMNLLKKVEYKSYFLKSCIPALKLEKKNEEELMSIIELSNFNEKICSACIQYLNLEENVLCLMEQKGVSSSTIKTGLSKILWASKNDDQILEIMKRINYHPNICEAGVKFLKSETSIFALLGFAEYNYIVIEAAIPYLHLEQKKDDILLQIMKSSNYNQKICDACLNFFKLEERNDVQIISIMEEVEYNTLVCSGCIGYIKGIGNFWGVLESCQWNTEICLNVLSRIKAEPELSILKLLSNNKYDPDLCSEAVLLLKDKENIKYVLHQTNYHNEVCEKAVLAAEAIDLFSEN